jgi:uncharacterized protein YdiU (UPF0061 family)
MDRFGFQIDNSFLQLPSVLYTTQAAKPVKDPSIILLNEDLANEIGLSSEKLLTLEGAAILSGNAMIEGVTSFAQAYSGHQFGYFTQLGDGRAMMLGEHLKPDGQRVDIQLKGSGPTPYSRRGDGRASLGPMLREYLISEAMAHLGVPTTRSLAVVRTGEKVIRESLQEGAILTRVASSHIRVGTFQFAVTQSYETLEALYEYTLKRHYAQCLSEDATAECLLFEFAKRQAKLIAQWQGMGFVHGVMNTDNVSLAGETIDYGPCAFLDTYHPDALFSSIDTGGRYRYRNQPIIGKWNLARFAETILPLMKEDGERIGNAALDYYDKIYKTEYLHIMQQKLGLCEGALEVSLKDSSVDSPEDFNLINELLGCMTADGLDYHDTFLKLTIGHYETSSDFPSEAFSQWHKKWVIRKSQQSWDAEKQNACMRMNNPAIIPRNHNVERVLSDWVNHGNDKPFKALLELLQNPYQYTDAQIEAGAPQKHWPKNYTTTCGT